MAAEPISVAAPTVGTTVRARFGNPEHRIDKIGILVRWSLRPQAG